MRNPSPRNPLARYPRLCHLLSLHYSLPLPTVACALVCYRDTRSQDTARLIANAVAVRHAPCYKE